jgi:hypothetical protein
MRFALRRVAAMWDCEGEFELDGPHSVVLWEPLDVNAPLDAKPYCCLVNTVIFYRDKVGYDEIARCRTHDLNTSSETLLFLGNRWWSVCSGKVVQRDGKWCMQWSLRDNTRHAFQANAGQAAERAQQLAKVN